MTNISRQQAIEALREFRVASSIISIIHVNAGRRWSDGIVNSAPEPCAYTDVEIDDYRRARQHLLKSLSLNPYFPDTHWMLANSFEEIDNDKDRLLQYYNSCLDLDPAFDDVIVARMGVLIKNGDLKAAEKDLLSLERLGSHHAISMREHYQNQLNAE